MATRVAINGFGRIGRLVFRALHEQGLLAKELEIVAVGDIVPADNLAYLLKYDSTQGAFKGKVGSKKSAAAIPRSPPTFDARWSAECALGEHSPDPSGM